MFAHPKLSNSPFFFLTLAIALGIIAFVYLRTILAVPLLLGLTLLYALPLGKSWQGLLFWILPLSLGYLAGYWSSQSSPSKAPDSTQMQTSLMEASYYRAYVLEPPVRSGRRYRCVLQVDAYWQPTLAGSKNQPLQHSKALVLAEFYQGFSFLQVGDELWIRGQPSPVVSDSTQGKTYASYLAHKGIYWRHTLRLQDAVRTDRVRGFWLWRTAQRLRVRCQMGLQLALSKPSAALAQGILLGEKRHIHPDHLKAFSAAGLAHLLVVSGLHVGLIFTWLFALSVFFLRMRWLSYLLALGGAGFFVVMVGMPVAAMRAWVMLLVFVFVRLLNRENSSFNVLGLAAAALLLWDAQILFTLSFQLSVLAVLGIIVTYKAFRRLFVLPILRVLALSCAAQIFLFPLLAHYFYTIPLYAIASNLWLVPMLFVCLPWALLVGVLPMVTELSVPLDYVLNFMQQTMLWVKNLPYSYWYPVYWDRVELLALYLLLGLLWIWQAALLRGYRCWVLVAWTIFFVAYGWYQLRAQILPDKLWAQGHKNTPLLYYFHQGHLLTTDAAWAANIDPSFWIKQGYWRSHGHLPVRLVPWCRLSPTVSLAYLGDRRLLWVQGAPSHTLALTSRDILLASDGLQRYYRRLGKAVAPAVLLANQRAVPVAAPNARGLVLNKLIQLKTPKAP